jgi:hypothetical protein
LGVQWVEHFSPPLTRIPYSLSATHHSAASACYNRVERHFRTCFSGGDGIPSVSPQVGLQGAMEREQNAPVPD